MKKKSAKDEFATLEDRILWETVAKTARPLKGKEKPTFLIDEKKEQASIHPSAPENPRPVLAAVEAKPTPAHRLHPIDRPTHKKIAKGRVDHRSQDRSARPDPKRGLWFASRVPATRASAQTSACSCHHRKGIIHGQRWRAASGGSHVVYDAAFRILVNGYEDAARNHGGTGAIYVRMRRQSETP